MNRFYDSAKKMSLVLLVLVLVFAAAPARPQAASVSAEGAAEEKIVYLTFDDGPGVKVTPRILEILKEEGVPATFFVLGSEVDRNPEMLRQIYREGHGIANHTYGHEYDYLYADPQNLTEDIRKAEESINNALGFNYGNRCFRFPGGASQRDQKYRDAVSQMGYYTIGWNSSGEDSVSPEGAAAQEILNNVIASAGDQKEVVALLHDNDAKSTTADALPQIIKYFRDRGYEFRSLQDRNEMTMSQK